MAVNNYNKSTAPARGAQQNTGNRQGLPVGYLSSGYSDKNGDFDIKYVTTLASEIARQFGFSQIAKSKVRNYYNSLCSILEQLRFNAIDIKQAERELAKMKPRVINRGNKGTASDIFVEFINKNVDLILSTPKDKKIQVIVDFKDHFEAVVGYMR